MQFPVSIELHRSFLLSFLLVQSHVAAVACIGALPWPWHVRLPVLVLIGVSMWHTLRQPRIIGLHLYGPDRLDCLLRDGSHAVLKIQPDSTVFSQLIVLRLRIGEETQVRHLTLLPDHMTAEQFRALRLWLRWHAVVKEDAGAAF